MFQTEINIISHKPRPWIYLLIIAMVVSCIAALPFIKTTISIRSNGIIRPANERTEVKPIITGNLDQLYVREGDTVKQGQLIAAIKDNINQPKIILNQVEQNQRKRYVDDLIKLTSNDNFNSILLETPLYKKQLNKFVHQLADHHTAIKKVSIELQIFTSLLKDKVIAPKEHFDKEIELERLNNTLNAFKNDQLALWQNDLQRYQLDISQFQSQKNQINIEQNNYFIHAPVSGVIQNINTRYIGGFIAAGESLCIISPLSELLGECYLSTKDIGLLKIGHSARFQVDAFDYNYFGMLTGKVISIENDFSLINNKPAFKVHCSFDRTQLYLKNGFNGSLKKGLSFQARFVVAERTLWQLLFDKVDDWFNPVAPNPIITASVYEK
ncbi:HlyD family secretion protein [Sediminibacterium sp.]|jgi:multidrug resistance efflux pump|uniref:HlyD family secretion protein n=1 Tax=Sediminibacterium sp. TaxID=1917865 RepID=UPI00271C84A7|nr:HlyD family efflux transporter periplasmic adaptor subunit [Sediminibacterium sp.]MDO9155857.1 HlyD family efflux transporter periplasmic adaptor subunit [Sediminibacterium sp.]MDP1973540.1 HlyD family efflux transporter periplasmic adaptor subunit [Sediminibacterium sp.]MDP2421051.1 HlyD family efflux transporter periplasmic adaptor subunit [Sediminibacterium sp.]